MLSTATSLKSTDAPMTSSSDIASKTDAELLGVMMDPSRPAAERAQACSWAGQRRLRDALPALLQIARIEENPLLVWASLAALGTLGSRVSTRPLIMIFRSTQSPTKRQGAIFALGRLYDPRARSVLVKIVSDRKEDDKSRGLAAEALGLLRPAKASTSALIGALGDDEAEVRYSALLAVGALRCREALPAVERLKNDSTPVDGDGTIADHASMVISDIESAPGRRPAVRPRSRITGGNKDPGRKRKGQ